MASLQAKKCSPRCTQASRLRFTLFLLLVQILIIGNNNNNVGLASAMSSRAPVNTGTGSATRFSGPQPSFQQKASSGFGQQQRNVPVRAGARQQQQQHGQGYVYPGNQGGLSHGAADDWDRRRPINANLDGSYGSGGNGGGGRGSDMGYADTMVQGNSRSTWTSDTPGGYHGNLVTMETEGRPLFGTVEVWEGPNNTPLRFKVYSEDGRARPFQALVEPSPVNNGMSQTLSVRNAGPLEFPMAAGVQKTMPSVPPISAAATTRSGMPLTIEHGAGRYSPARSYYSDSSNDNYLSTVSRGSYMNKPNGVAAMEASTHPDSQTVTIDGGALKTISINPGQSPKVKIRIHSQGLPVTAMLEVWVGPGHARQVVEVESQDGLNRPFACAIDTYGYGATICVRNLGPITYPILLTAEPLF